MLLRAEGLDRSILVTDATAAAAAPPGRYELAGMAIEHAPDGSVRVPGSAVLAGSALTLDRAVRNLVAWGLASPGQAIRLASDNPAAAMAPALIAHGIRLRPAMVTWSERLEVTAVLADAP